MDLEKNNILIILGMHRSGTSLFTNWLSTCGLTVGDHLLSARPSNPNGHFEDLDFVEFHDRLLKENGMDVFSTEGKIVISNYFKKRAKSLVNFKSELHSQWGWKDPRTCLFISLWQDIIPKASYIILFRDYQKVIKSLLKRDFQRLEKKYKKGVVNWIRRLAYRYRLEKKISDLARQYLISWCYYNECLITLLKKNKDILVVDADKMLDSDQRIFYHLTEVHQFKLNFRPLTTLFNIELWNTAKGYSFDYSLDKELIEKADNIFSTLRNYSEISINISDNG